MTYLYERNNYQKFQIKNTHLVVSMKKSAIIVFENKNFLFK
jgi:hypothetical protein